MPTVNTICQYLSEFAPNRLAESWDNTGLLLGDREKEVHKVMTCLTVTPQSTAEAVREQVDIIVSHHPMMFRPINKITRDSVQGSMLIDLLRSDIAVYSPHTAFDSTRSGINESICAKLEIENAKPLQEIEAAQDESIGAGRIGELKNAMNQSEFSDWVKQKFGLDSIRTAGQASGLIKRVAVACGSGGTFMGAAHKLGADAFVTGEATFHTCLEAEANQIAMCLVGHFASERFAVEELAQRLQGEFANTTSWASRNESDPLSVV